jgi:hypothetical protein
LLVDHVLPVVVFTPVRWDLLSRRRQQLLAWIARSRRVVVVEEPAPDDCGTPRWERHVPVANVIVQRPRTPLRPGGFRGLQLPVVTRMLRAALAKGDLGLHVAWLATPMAWPVAQALGPALTVYDCLEAPQDRLLAPPELHEREAALLAAADLVLVAGRGGERVRLERQRPVHCVDGTAEIDGLLAVETERARRRA